MAMKLGGTYKFRSVSLRNFQKLATSFDIKFNLLEKQIKYFEKNILKEAKNLAEELNQAHKSQSVIYQRIIEVIELNLESISYR